MNYQDKQKLILVLWILAIIGASIGIFFMTKRVRIGLEEYLKSREEILSFQEKVSSFEKGKEDFQEQKKEIDKIRESFFKPGKDELERIGKLASDLESLAGQNKASIEATEVVQPSENESFYLISFNISGDFPDVLRFFFAIENVPLEYYQLMGIEKVNLSRFISSSCPEEGENENGDKECSRKTSVNGEFQLKIYIEPKIEENSEEKQLEE